MVYGYLPYSDAMSSNYFEQYQLKPFFDKGITNGKHNCYGNVEKLIHRNLIRDGFGTCERALFYFVMFFIVFHNFQRHQLSRKKAKIPA